MSRNDGRDSGVGSTESLLSNDVSFVPHPPAYPRPARLFSTSRRYCRKISVVNEADLTDQKKIGRGAFGEVILANLNGHQVVMKVGLHSGGQSIANEVSVMKRLFHPNLPSLIADVASTGKRCFVMEYLNGGTLKTFIEGEQRAEAEVISLLFNVSAALEYLHKQRLVHRDIKADNVMLHKHGDKQIAVLSDLGSARRVGEPASDVGITLLYLDPDICMQYAAGTNDVPCTFNQDIYAFGLLMMAAVNQGLPWQSKPSLYMLSKANHPALASPEGVSPSFKAVASRCTFFRKEDESGQAVRDTSKRPTSMGVHRLMSGLIR